MRTADSKQARSRGRSEILSSPRPFRRSEALAAGITLAELTGPGIRRVFHDVYVTAGVRLSPIERARAALWVLPEGCYASHHTAARIWGGTPPEHSRTHISVPAGRNRSQRRGIAAHSAVGTPDLRHHRGVPVSSPAQCFCELASDGADLVELVVLGDSLVKAGVVTPEELIAAADAWTHKRAATARRAARYVRRDVDSPMESRIRMLIVLAGLPEPVVNFRIRHENGEWKLRFDLSYPELKLLIEYDGDHHATDPQQRARDLERREEIERMGWRIIVIQKTHFYRQPAGIVDRVRRARLDRGASPASCRVRTTWMNHFAQG